MARTNGKSRTHRFATHARLLLGYNLLVILWGAVVRATGSGAGCGEHWPLCQGRMIPHAEQIATAIEFAHRATSGVDLLLVAGMIWLAFRWFGRGHLVRRYATATGIFTVTEGMVGAALVLFGDVGKNVSMERVVVLSAHLVNTFLLLASLALTAWAAGESSSPVLPESAPREQNRSKGIYGACAAGLLAAVAIGITGTIAALADVLYPAKSLTEALRWDFASRSAPLLHLRIIHPAMAALLGGYLLIWAVFNLNPRVPAAARRMALRLVGLLLLQFCLGALNMLLLAPVWMQVVHLLAADLVWITVVLLSAEILSGRTESVLPNPLPSAVAAGAAPHASAAK